MSNTSSFGVETPTPRLEQPHLGTQLEPIVGAKAFADSPHFPFGIAQIPENDRNMFKIAVTKDETDDYFYYLCSHNPDAINFDPADPEAQRRAWQQHRHNLYFLEPKNMIGSTVSLYGDFRQFVPEGQKPDPALDGIRPLLSFLLYCMVLLPVPDQPGPPTRFKPAGGPFQMRPRTTSGRVGFSAEVQLRKPPLMIPELTVRYYLTEGGLAAESDVEDDEFIPEPANLHVAFYVIQEDETWPRDILFFDRRLTKSFFDHPTPTDPNLEEKVSLLFKRTSARGVEADKFFKDLGPKQEIKAVIGIDFQSDEWSVEEGTWALTSAPVVVKD